ncbi:unnamed protein product [Citrullus colocynthis]|uniref:Uncharacterized protein n=1 Tax=Citrullus colocynthis TaxID=252529 RepID=A0ABP0Z402_9ROSI
MWFCKTKLLNKRQLTRFRIRPNFPIPRSQLQRPKPTRELPNKEAKKIRNSPQKKTHNRHRKAGARDQSGEADRVDDNGLSGVAEGLTEREFGLTELLAKVGEIVAERAREEVEILRDDGKVEERMVTEPFRILKLMEMNLAMVKAAVKEETLSERLGQAKARCRQAILVANSF